MELLIPAFTPSPKGGRRRTVDDCAALNGILFVLQTGIPWEYLPKELDFGSGMTCWRRLRDWQAAGVWEQLHLAMLRRLREHDQIDWDGRVLMLQVFRAPGGQETGPNPTDRGKFGSKRHVVVDARGVPLVVTVTVPTGTWLTRARWADSPRAARKHIIDRDILPVTVLWGIDDGSYRDHLVYPFTARRIHSVSVAFATAHHTD